MRRRDPAMCTTYCCRDCIAVRQLPCGIRTETLSSSSHYQFHLNTMASPKVFPALLLRINRSAPIRFPNPISTKPVYIRVVERQRQHIWQVSSLTCHVHRRHLSQQNSASKLYSFEDVSCILFSTSKVSETAG